MGQSGIDQLTREEGEEYIATARDSAEYETLRDTFTTEPRTRWTVYRVGTGEITRYICVFDIQNLEENTQGNTIIVIERNDIVHAEICLDHYTDDQIIQSEFITAEETRLESQSAEIIASSEKAGPAD